MITPLKQLNPTMLDNAGLYHKVKKGIPKVLGGMASIFPITKGIKLSAGFLNPAIGGGMAGGGIVNFGSKTLGDSVKILKKLQSKLTKVKQQYPSSLPKGWNKGGSKQAFEYLKKN
jgi:hypothetical protein